MHCRAWSLGSHGFHFAVSVKEVLAFCSTALTQTLCFFLLLQGVGCGCQRIQWGKGEASHACEGLHLSHNISVPEGVILY